MYLTFLICPSWFQLVLPPAWHFACWTHACQSPTMLRGSSLPPALLPGPSPPWACGLVSPAALCVPPWTVPVLSYPAISFQCPDLRELASIFLYVCLLLLAPPLLSVLFKRRCSLLAVLWIGFLSCVLLSLAWCSLSPVLRKTCNQVPLASKVMVSRVPSPSAGSPGSEPSQQWENFLGIIVLQFVGHLPGVYGIWFYCDCTPPTVLLWLLHLWTCGIFFWWVPASSCWWLFNG